MPVEEALLVKGQQSRFSINQVCESFRVSAAPCFDSDDMWGALNQLASSQLSALCRQLKVSNVKVSKRHCPAKTPAHIWSHLASEDFFQRLLSMPVMSVSGTNVIAQIKVLCPDMAFQELQSVEFVWSNVQISNLPAYSRDMQMDALAKHGSCQMYQHALSNIHACIPCALKSKTSVLGQKFAYNCASNTLQCATCSRQASSIHMLGRVLRVRDVNYSLCLHCLKPCVWGQPCQCRDLQPVRVDLSACLVCGKKTFEVVHKVLDVETLRITHTPLCFQHSRHCVVSHSTVYDTKALMRELCRK
jgi:hypothetical protein